MFRQLSRVISSGNGGGGKFRLKLTAIHEWGRVEWTSRRTKASSRTSARLWDNPAVINTLTGKEKNTHTHARRNVREHLGSLHFGRGSDIAQGRRCYRCLTISFIIRIRARHVYASLSRLGRVDTSTLSVVAIQRLELRSTRKTSRGLVEAAVHRENVGHL